MKDVSYAVEEIPYILEVMRKFEISYKLDEFCEFIPALCDRNELENFAMQNVRSTITYKLSYQYLPHNVIHKLMIQMHDDLDFSKIWLSGARFESKETGCWAIIRGAEKKLEIIVHSTNQAYDSWTYLTRIRCQLKEINKHLNLEPEEFIVYNEDGLEDIFPYAQIIQMIIDGEDAIYAPNHRRRINLMDIISLVEGQEGVARMNEKLKRQEPNQGSMNFNFYGSVNRVVTTQNGDISMDEGFDIQSLITLLEKAEEMTFQQTSSILAFLRNQQQEVLKALADDLETEVAHPKKFGQKLKDWLSSGANLAQLGSLGLQVFQILTMN